ncbi:SusE domain-containing protein [Hymenobacter arizonensis]|uniref:SusE outer membrane protein n=1 Tax=Hymenobacter arizonensis TaxID=1227077 RepID=A0A1I5UQN0_HYMAR|nr:SusE domain-containing protein [Hymenobacter arizonensis]SFP97539.1 SusE outer membrane protein [Hymenobacter arizonensis]
MKNWLTQVVAGLLAVTTLASCEKDEDKVTIAPSNAITLSTSTSTVVLTQANSAQNAAAFTWTPVSSFAISGTDRPTAPAVTYRLQVAKSATGFGYPFNIEAGTGSTKSVTVGELNSGLINLGITPGVATSVFVRVAAVVGTDAQTFVSAPVPMTVTAYTVCLPPNADVWSIIGTAGVDWNTDVPLTYNCDTRTYDLTRTLNAGEFKFRKNAQWNVNNVATNYGANARNSGGTGTLVLDGPNIVIPTTGMYTLKFNLNNLTYTLQ